MVQPVPCIFSLAIFHQHICHGWDPWGPMLGPWSSPAKFQLPAACQRGDDVITTKRGQSILLLGERCMKKTLYSFQCSGFMIFIGPLALPKSLNISLWISLKRPSATCTLRQYTYNSLSFWSDWLHWACFGIQICWIPVESEHWQSKPPVNESSTDKALDVHHLQDIEQMGTTRSNGWFTKGIQRVAIDW